METRQQVEPWAPALPTGVRTPGARALAALDGSDQSRPTHALVRSAMLGLVQGGCTDEQAARIVETSPGLSWRVGTEQRRGWGWLLRRAADARAWAALHPAADRAPELTQQLVHAEHLLLTWVPDRDLTGVPQLAKLRAVGVALIELARELGRDEHLSVGCRELARRAGVHESTARKALACWGQVGLVELTAAGGRWVDGVQQAAAYRLHLDALSASATSSEPALIEPGAVELMTHDAWRHGGLGHGAWAAWALLHPEQGTDAETLAAQLSLRPRAARELLERLALHRLAVRTAAGWRRCTVTQAHELLQLAAVIEGTDGAGARVLERHQLQRRERAYQHARYRESVRREHRRRETEHLVGMEPETVEHAVLVGAPASPTEPVPLAADGDRVLVMLDELAERGSALRRISERGTPRTSALAARLQRTGERMARLAEQYEHELAAARAAGAQGGEP